MDIEFSGVIFTWRGPSPYFYVRVPADQSDAIKAISASVTYGWGVIPARVWIGETEWTTSLFPKDGDYLVPLKDKVRKAEHLEEGDTVRVRIEVG